MTGLRPRRVGSNAGIEVGDRAKREIRLRHAPAAGPVRPNFVTQRPDRNAKDGGGMSPVAGPPDQRLADQFAFDGRNRTPHEPANSVNLSFGEFRVTEEHFGHNGGFRREHIAQRHLPPKLDLQAATRHAPPRASGVARMQSTNAPSAPTPSSTSLRIKNQKASDSAIRETWEVIQCSGKRMRVPVSFETGSRLHKDDFLSPQIHIKKI